MIDLRRWPEADGLLDRALDLPREERRAFIDREAGHCPDLAEALHTVLAEAEWSDGFLEHSRPDVASLLANVWEDARKEEPPALEVGQRFMTYEVIELVGRGGMGEVYRARDERLGRMVALKVLPREFVEDRQRLAHFDREARLLASLNHPNIAAIYGLAEDGGRQALVLEFVEGTTLAARIEAGPLPIREALPIATQIAFALETAHRRGIVHRDLKPSNVSLMADGTVKLLDFGLAKAVEPGLPAGPDDLTSIHDPGRIVGTPAYMSPEQARGGDVDQRTDVWAFGCVLFEMLTGARAFDGGSTDDVVVRVPEREPDFSLLPPSTPEALQRVLRRALTRDPGRRLANLGSAVLDLQEAQQRTKHAGILSRGSPAVRAAAAIVILAAGIGGGILLSRAVRSGSPPTVARLAVPVPPSDLLIASAQQVAALSPDGRTVVYRASRGGSVRLFKRVLDGMQSEPVPGTENAAGPFFSPDGAWLGFDGAGTLQKVSLAGGSPVTICKAPGGANASWGGHTIVFATATGRMLNSVPAGGGTPEPLTLLNAAAGDLAHTFPFVMPGGDAALFTIVRAQERHVAVVRLDTKEVSVLTTGSQPRYLAPGHLLFIRDDTMWAAPFDERRLQITGAAVPVLEGLDTAGGAAAHFAAGGNGSLLYAPRRVEVRERQPVWLDRRGVETPLPFEPRGYTRAALAPDGRHVALALSERNNTDIWVGEIDGGTMTRLTRDPTTETAPLWTPDGRAVVYRSERDGGGLFVQTVDAADAWQRLTNSGNRFQTPHGWARDGRTLLFTEFRSDGGQSIHAIVPGSSEVRPLLTGSFAQLRPQISPDGRWMAYQSDESGRFEIYVRPFPDVEGGKWQISTAGGTSPRWAHSGRELFYYDGQSLVAASINAAKAFSVQEHTRLFTYAPFASQLGPDFEVAPDDQRFLMLRSNSDTPASRLQLVVVQNWIDELRRKLASSGR